MVYFSAIPRDGIFEIDLSNSYTNENSIYTVSNKRAKLDLDSALLWHCRLGHISKKRIEKLQHDGLLNSTDLRAFEKCVPCMSGKMARKPYTHQVERAKDLLGLIHTDVCGPFKITSRQGANYFVTFTDDFSRYGYVYLVFGSSQGSWDYRPSYSSLHSTIQIMSERRNRTLLDMVRSMMSQTTLPKSFWDYALETAARILNMVPTKKVEKTPYEVWHGQAPKLSYLKVWGVGTVKRDTLTKPDKLEPRSIKCIFIGYPKETMGYSFYYPPENKVLVARNAEFLENNLIDQEASGSLEDLEIIQEEDTHPSIDTSLNHEEDDLEMMTSTEHELGDLGEPANYKAALLDPESDKWLTAMNVEMQSMKDNEVWILVELPPNGKTVGSKWLFKKKTDMDGAVHTYKAPIRILIAIAAYYDYEIWQMDVKTASSMDISMNRFIWSKPEVRSIPCKDKLRLSKSQGASTPAELKQHAKCSILPGLMWVPLCIAVRCLALMCGFLATLDAGYLNGMHDDLKSQTGLCVRFEWRCCDCEECQSKAFSSSSEEKAEYMLPLMLLRSRKG
ncbi:retrotransposon protein, putative, ty1-copia subclass [Tanacetum coccineum]